MIRGVIIGSEKITTRFNKIQAQALPKLTARIQKVVIKLQGAVIKDKLSGQVLNVRSNNLRSSIHQSVTTSGGTITGIVGTNVEYAAYHEYGLNDTINVKEHLRRTKAEKIAYVKGKNKGKLNPLAMRKAQKKKAATITVKAHTRKVNYPEHSYLRSAMADMQGEIRVEISEGMKEAIK